VIDEAGARVRLKAMTRPPDLKDLDSQIETLNTTRKPRSPSKISKRPPICANQADKLRRRKKASPANGVKSRRKSTGWDEEVIREVVNKMTGVPLTRIGADETKVY